MSYSYFFLTEVGESNGKVRKGKEKLVKCEKKFLDDTIALKGQFYL